MAFAFKGISYLPVSAMYFQFSHPYGKMEMKKGKNALIDTKLQSFNNQIFFKVVQAMAIF